MRAHASKKGTQERLARAADRRAAWVQNNSVSYNPKSNNRKAQGGRAGGSI